MKMTVHDQMKHKLMILAGLPRHPTDAELDAIIDDIVEVKKTRLPTDGDWIKAAGRHVPGAGTHKYAGEDMSNLNALLMQIQNARPSSGSRKG